MKQNALNWNRSTVTDDVIIKDLVNLSKGKVTLEGVTELSAVKTLAVNKFQDDYSDGFRKNNYKHKKFIPKKKFKKHK